MGICVAASATIATIAAVAGVTAGPILASSTITAPATGTTITTSLIAIGWQPDASIRAAATRTTIATIATQASTAAGTSTRSTPVTGVTAIATVTAGRPILVDIGASRVGTNAAVTTITALTTTTADTPIAS